VSQSRQLAAIMFTDIVGFTALMGDDEEKGFDLLIKNRQVQKPLIAKYHGKWIKEIGDGVLASFNSVSDAVYCAGAIHKACENESDLSLRIGIHVGEVVFEGEDVFGSGVNIASRLESLAPVGGILVSESVYRNIQNRKGIHTEFNGEENLKNVKDPIKIYQLKITDWDVPESKVSERQSVTAIGVPWKSKSQKKLAVVLSIVVLIAMAFLFFVKKKKEDTSGQLVIKAEPKSLAVAVMPFRNDSEDPQNIYFCNGLMEDVINQLSKINGIRVPSITSMLYYRTNPQPYDIIVEDLKVTHLLEGSVRKLHDRVLMNVTLIDAKENSQIWSNRYEMDLSVKEVWDIQFEIAGQIMKSMQFTLSEDVKANSKDIPTSDYLSYDNYLRAKDLLKSWHLDENRKAIDLLNESIFRDPNFYVALAELSFAYSQRTELTSGHWLDSAGHYAQLAVGIKSDLVEALVAQGYYETLVGDTREGLRFYQEAYDLNPKVPNNFLGWCHMQMGNYQYALEWALKMLKDDPNNAVFYVDAADAANALGLFATARTLTNEALVIRPGLQWAVHNGIQTYYYENKYVDALKYVEDSKDKGDLGTANEANIYLALAYYKLGESELALSHLRQIVDEHDGRMSVMDIAQKHLATSLLGFILKQTGNIDEGQSVLEGLIKEVELTLNEQFPEKSMILACCYAAMGKQEKCLEALEGNYVGIMVNYYDLALFPSFDIMREEPGFQEIMNSLKERTEEMRESVLAKGYLDDILPDKIRRTQN